MKISYEVTEEDFLGAYERFWRSNKQGSTSAYIFGFGAILFGSLTHIPFDRVRPFSLALVAAGALIALLPLWRRRLYRRAYRENPKYYESIEADFREENISVRSAVGSSELEWGIYRRALETPDAFLLTLTKNSFSIIPKRAFASEEMEEEFRSLLRNMVGRLTLI